MTKSPYSFHSSTKNPFVSRRDFLLEAGEGIGSLALGWLLAQDGLLASDDITSEDLSLIHI